MSDPNETPVENLEARVVARAGEDPQFRQKLLSDPRAAVREFTGTDLPAGFDLRVVEETPNTLYLVLPADASGELSDEQLETHAGGNVPTTDYGDRGDLGFDWST